LAGNVFAFAEEVPSVFLFFEEAEASPVPFLFVEEARTSSLFSVEVITPSPSFSASPVFFLLFRRLRFHCVEVVMVSGWYDKPLAEIHDVCVSIVVEREWSRVHLLRHVSQKVDGMAYFLVDADRGKGFSQVVLVAQLMRRFTIHLPLSHLKPTDSLSFDIFRQLAFISELMIVENHTLVHFDNL